MDSLKEGQKAPDFSGVDQNGKNVSLADFLGRKLVLYFYPKDNTPTCTVEACNLRDNYKVLQDKGFEILGVSADSERKHRNFIKKFDLPFSLLADTDHETINKYKVWGWKQFMGREFEGIHRKTFVIDEKGVIKKIFHKVKSKNHSAEILESMGLS